MTKTLIEIRNSFSRIKFDEKSKWVKSQLCCCRPLSPQSQALITIFICLNEHYIKSSQSVTSSALFINFKFMRAHTQSRSCLKHHKKKDQSRCDRTSFKRSSSTEEKDSLIDIHKCFFLSLFSVKEKLKSLLKAKLGVCLTKMAKTKSRV